MAYQSEDGSWRTDANSVNYATEAEAHQAEQRWSMGKDADADPHGTLAAVGAFGKLAMLIPSFFSMIIGFVMGGLLKLGIFGRIVLTLIFSACLLILLAIPLQPFIGKHDGMPQSLEIVFSVVLVALTLVAAVWFFTKHYRVLKETSMVELTTFCTICGTIVFWGVILFGIIGWIAGITKYGWSTSVIVFLPFLVAFAVWMYFLGEKMKVMIIVLAATVALCVVDVVGQGMLKDVRNGEYAKMVEENPELAVVFKDMPYEATVTANTQGTMAKDRRLHTVDIPAGSTITVVSRMRVGASEDRNYEAIVMFEGDWRQMVIV